MIQAEMKGKVPGVQNMEDVLTSSVFGLLKYITKPSILIHILSYAKTLMGKSLLDCIDFDLHLYTPEFMFWEQLGTHGEPDLIIKFKRPGHLNLILCVEVKYYSSKSGEGDNDQLKRYFEGTMEFASLSKSTFLGVIYLTKYPSRIDVSKSLEYINEKGMTDAEDKLFQMKWFEIAAAIKEQDLTSVPTAERQILNDIHEYLHYKNLVSFSNFSFQVQPFEINLDKFYESTAFKGFTFIKKDFDILTEGLIYR